MTQSQAALQIVDPGLLSTIQDLGRLQVGRYGVAPSGAADWLSCRAANMLVGNDVHAAVIETTMNGISFKALQTLRIAVTGAQAALSVAGGTKPLWQTVVVRAGCEAKIGAPQSGLRSYVAVQGGFTVSLVLGGASTDTTAGFGGLGRPLASGDRLMRAVGESEYPELERTLTPSARPQWYQQARLRVLAGPHVNALSEAQREALCSQTYRVSTRSNRQGLRLEGKPLASGDGFDVLSCGVCAGCVQLTSDGLPLILLAEHQTTGGYVVPFVVCTADTPLAAQLRPGNEVRFDRYTYVEASIALWQRIESLNEALHNYAAH